MMPSHEERLLEPLQLRALAHPQRVQLLRLLREEGPSTATHLAQRLGVNSGLTSYHLRQLALYGFVEEDPDCGTARERWWRPTFHAHRIDPAYFLHDPELRGVLDAYLQEALTTQLRQAARWLAEQGTWEPAWVSAATFSDRLLRLTPEKLSALVDELDKVISQYEGEDPDGEQVVVVLQAFPRCPRAGTDKES
jgi:DNA-binding transcriptional ArsR family regulator